MPIKQFRKQAEPKKGEALRGGFWPTSPSKMRREVFGGPDGGHNEISYRSCCFFDSFGIRTAGLRDSYDCGGAGHVGHGWLDNWGMRFAQIRRPFLRSSQRRIANKNERADASTGGFRIRVRRRVRGKRRLAEDLVNPVDLSLLSDVTRRESPNTAALAGSTWFAG